MLRVEDLAVSFGKINALNGVSFEVQPREIVTLIGANGAGKSTTVRAIAGLTKLRAGSVHLDERDLTGLPARDVVKAGLTLLPQGRQLFGSMSVRENIEMGAFVRAKDLTVADDIERWLEFFPEIADKMSSRAAHLSGGQQQIVALIRGLMANPHVLMLDEPSIGIAPLVVTRIAEELHRLSRDAGVAILLVEQNIAFAFDLADRVVVLAQGRDVFTGTPDEVRDPDVLATYFFGEASGGGTAARSRPGDTKGTT
jgi:branched-chain amino acid transport system ATP-binding protein